MTKPTTPAPVSEPKYHLSDDERAAVIRAAEQGDELGTELAGTVEWMIDHHRRESAREALTSIMYRILGNRDEDEDGALVTEGATSAAALVSLAIVEVDLDRNSVWPCANYSAPVMCMGALSETRGQGWCEWCREHSWRLKMAALANPVRSGDAS